MQIRRTLLLLTAAALLLAAASAEVYVGKQPPADWQDRPVLRLTTFPAVHNDAALLQVGGKTMLIDGGFEGWVKDVRASLTAMGCGDGVDVIFNTHPHDDHIGTEIRLVRQGFRAGEFWSTFPEDYDDPYQQEMVTELRAAGIPYRQLANGEALDFGGAHMVFMYYPEGRDPNALSAVTHITFGSATLLLTADVSTAAQDWFHLNVGGALKAQVMKFPHHGITIARPAFLDDADPEFAYVTNRQRDTRKANQQLKSRHIRFLHTSVGPLTLVTDGTDWYIWQEKAPY